MSAADWITPAVERAAFALLVVDHGDNAHMYAVNLAEGRDVLVAALDAPKDQYDCMDDITIAVHSAICETSPEDCVAYRGPCVKAVEAARIALLGGAR